MTSDPLYVWYLNTPSRGPKLPALDNALHASLTRGSAWASEVHCGQRSIQYPPPIPRHPHCLHNPHKRLPKAGLDRAKFLSTSDAPLPNSPPSE